MLDHQARVTVETKLVFNVAALFPSQLSSSQPLTVPIILTFRRLGQANVGDTVLPFVETPAFRKVLTSERCLIQRNKRNQ